MNSEDFGKYLAYLRKESGFKSQRAFSEKSGISNATLSRAESGERIPNKNTLKLIANHLKGVSYSELLNHAGLIDGNDYTQWKDNKDLADFEQSIDQNIKIALKQLWQQNKKSTIKSILEVNNIPLNESDVTFEEISTLIHQMEETNKKSELYSHLISELNKMGISIQQDFSSLTNPVNEHNFNENNNSEQFFQIISYINNSNNKSKEYIIVERNLLGDSEGFAFLVQDDSLVGESIFEGDTLVCKSKTDAYEEGLYVVEDYQSAPMVRRVTYQNNYIILSSANNHYFEPIVFSDSDEFKIIGKVVQIRRNIEVK
ncbi:helix-turn-helix domain-containing protein [Aquisalibacillus elongatus]|uniref:Helix-turn-helix protein n=1 Tax=Aquisalibacillus elongatus TaxID=485577 RepID=A0A3N5BGZ1_9BACI|nr:S24 family peptidase [Aquisalibacillus elongatus]RPF57036.1 helix-turn-helix protein [Aquisalibacillus elongatus]